MKSKKNKSALLNIIGYVQGVNFRYTVLCYAQENNLTGWVKNESDGSVSCFIYNVDELIINNLISWLKIKIMGINDIKINWINNKNKLLDFKIKY